MIAVVPSHPLLTRQEERRLSRTRRGRRDLVVNNLRLVGALAKRYRGLGLPIEDLIQEGAVGLMNAARKFDPRRGTRFSTYAHYWIRQAILRALRLNRLIHVPEGALLAGERGPKVNSLDAYAEDLEPADRPHPNAPAGLRDDLEAAIDLLPVRLRLVLEARFLTPPGLTLDELGSALRVSRERVRQLEAEGLRRAARAAPSLAGYL